MVGLESCRVVTANLVAVMQPEVGAAAASGSLSDAESAAADPGFSKGLTASAMQGRVDHHAVNVFFKVGV